MYERVDSKGNRSILLGQPADWQHSLPSNHRPLPWRDCLLLDCSVDTIVLPPTTERLFNAASIEPLEQMIVLLGLPHDGAFYSMAHLDITSKSTSFSVTEGSVADDYAIHLQTDLDLIKALVPEIRSVLAHTHPFVDEGKLRRRIDNSPAIESLLDVITHAYDMGEFPEFKHLRYEVGRAAAINCVTASQLSPDDMRFPGPESFQLLVSENPISQRATYSFFHVANDTAMPLKPVQFSADVPAPVAIYRKLLERAHELQCLVSDSLCQRFEAQYEGWTSKFRPSNLTPMLNVPPLLSRIIRQELFDHIVRCARGEVSEESLEQKCSNIDFSPYIEGMHT